MKRKFAMACLVLAALVLFAAGAYAACETEEAHRYGSWKYNLLPTCTQQGHQFRYCRYCDHWEQRWTKKLPHTVENWTVTQEPTCSEEGKQVGVCTECGGNARQSIEKLPHTLSEMTVTKEPTCTASGTGEYTCLVCDAKVREKLEKLGHDFGEMTVTKEPTCKASGTGNVTCQRCNKTQSQRIDKLEHVYSDWEITAEPEGNKKGTKTSTCTLCGEKKTQRFYWEGTLYEGVEPCEEVIRLQEMLRDLGYYKGNIRSGTFGSMTGKAVSRFRTEHGMKAAEVADPDTFAAIEAEWQKLTGADAE